MVVPEAVAFPARQFGRLLEAARCGVQEVPLPRLVAEWGGNRLLIAWAVVSDTSALGRARAWAFVERGT